MSKLFGIIKDIRYSYLKKKKNRIYFYNIWGKYNDNTRALVEAFHREKPEYELCYEVNEHYNKAEFPEYLKLVIRDSDEGRKCFYSANIIIDNDWGAIKYSASGLKEFIVLMLKKMCISKGALNISTGHGIPLKTIGNDTTCSNSYSHFITSSDVMIVSNYHSKEVFDRITFGKIPCYEFLGTPRNDCLFMTKKEIEDMKKKLGLDEKRIILFAPTFRFVKDGLDEKFVGGDQYLEDLLENSGRIVTELNNRFGGQWVIGLRTHPGVRKHVFREGEFIFDANENSDMADYLMISDILVTDYSSCSFDFMLTKRPCFLLWTDEKEYKEEQRGLYFDKEELPFPIVTSISELLDSLAFFDIKAYQKELEIFCGKYNVMKNDDSCRRIVKYVEDYLKKCSHKNK